MDLFTLSTTSSSALRDSFGGPEDRNGESTQPSTKNRSACNRCHLQKLRCIKAVGQVNCERCLRLKTACRSRLRAPRASPRSIEQAGQVTSHVQDDQRALVSASPSKPTLYTYSQTMISDLDDESWLFMPDSEIGCTKEQATTISDLFYPMQSDCTNMQETYWPGSLYGSRNVNSVAHDNSTDMDFTHVNENIIGYANNLPSPGMSASYMRIQNPLSHACPGTSPVSAVRKLASLNVELYECAMKLPSMARQAEPGSREATLFAIDELFCLTTGYIDVLQCFSPTRCETNISSSSLNPEQLPVQLTPSIISYSPKFSHLGQPLEGTSVELRSGLFSHVDEATMFMIVSYHCRLVEIYGSLFQMVQACIQHSLAPHKDKDWAVILPRLQVGSVVSPPVQVDIYTPLPPATASMYMLMITMVSSQLWQQLAGIIRNEGNLSVVSTSAPSCSMSESMCVVVTDKTECLLQSINATKILLQ